MVHFKNPKISARSQQDQLSTLITEALSKISQQDDIKNAILANHTNFDIEEDSYKLVSIVCDGDDNRIVEICTDKSNLIIGGIFNLDDNIAQIVNVCYIISDNQPKMGQYLKQSTLFQCYSEIDNNPGILSLGVISHVYGEEFDKYITQDGNQCDKTRYIKNIPTLRLGSSPRINNQIKPSIYQPRVPVRRNSSTTNIKREKIYKLHLVKYIK